AKKIDVRLIAATHKNLEQMVKEKSFREDLYYRLNVVRIETPPLRERMEDLPELVDYMLQRLNKDRSTGTTEISKEAMTILQQYDWPGNVRELENVLHSSSVVSKGKRILSKDLPDSLTKFLKGENKKGKNVAKDSNSESETKEQQTTDRVVEKEIAPVAPAFGLESLSGKKFAKDSDVSTPSAPSSISPGESYDIAYAHARETSRTNLLEVVEKEMIQRTMKESGGNQVKASAMLGITRATLRKRIDLYGIRY
ncbi:uncharacterized protein METZ01_LOCUS433578, partial [marine metagenome]